jgi:ubiquitin C-terminal hydrolase
LFEKLLLPTGPDQLQLETVTIEQCLEGFVRTDKKLVSEVAHCGNCKHDTCRRPRNGFCGLALPPVLVLVVNALNAVGKKYQTLIHFEQELNMAPYCEDGGDGSGSSDAVNASDTSTSYELFAVCCHQGATMEFGHNVALARDWDTDEWYHYNDGAAFGPMPFLHARAYTQHVPPESVNLAKVKDKECGDRPFYFMYVQKRFQGKR